MRGTIGGRSNVARAAVPIALPVRMAAAQISSPIWTDLGDPMVSASGNDWVPSTRRVHGGVFYAAKDGGVNDFHKFNITTGVWTALTGYSPSRGSGSAIFGVNGTELVLVQIKGTDPSPPHSAMNFTTPYTIGTDSWGADRTPCPKDALAYAPALCCDNGFIYVISGQSTLDPNIDSGNDSLNSWKYEMATDTWTQIANLDVGFWAAGADVGTDGKVYVIGGQRDSDAGERGVVRVYNPGSDTWDTSRANPPLPTGVTHNLQWPTVAALPDGKLLYGGGFPWSGGGGPSSNGQFWIYNPAADTFTATAASTTGGTDLFDLGNYQAAIDGAAVFVGSMAWTKLARFLYTP